MSSLFIFWWLLNSGQWRREFVTYIGTRHRILYSLMTCSFRELLKIPIQVFCVPFRKNAQSALGYKIIYYLPLCLDICLWCIVLPEANIIQYHSDAKNAYWLLRIFSSDFSYIDINFLSWEAFITFQRRLRMWLAVEGGSPTRAGGARCSRKFRFASTSSLFPPLCSCI